MKYNILKIVDDPTKLNEPVSEILGDVDYDKIKHVVNDIKDTIKANKDLTALCAPQIGEPLRLCCIRFADNKIRAFLNPMIVRHKGLHLSKETNASFKGKEFIVPRYDELDLAYQEVDGRVEANTFKGVPAEVIQQMVQMLDGILLTDYALDLDDVGGPEAFNKATDEEKQQVISLYLETLKKQSAQSSAEIESNAELKQLNDSIEFMKGYILGDIKPVDKEGHIVEAVKKD